MTKLIIIFIVSVILALLNVWIDSKIKKRKKEDIDDD